MILQEDKTTWLDCIGRIQNCFWGVRYDHITVLILRIRKDTPEQTV